MFVQLLHVWLYYGISTKVVGAQTLRFGKCCACLQLSHFLASSFSLCLSCAFLEAQPRAPGDEIKARKKTRQRGSLFGTELYVSCKLYNIYIDPFGPHPKRWFLRTYVSLWQTLKYHLVSWWPLIDFFCMCLLLVMILQGKSPPFSRLKFTSLLGT